MKLRQNLTRSRYSYGEYILGCQTDKQGPSVRQTKGLGRVPRVCSDYTSITCAIQMKKRHVRYGKAFVIFQTTLGTQVGGNSPPCAQCLRSVHILRCFATHRNATNWACKIRFDISTHPNSMRLTGSVCLFEGLFLSPS